MDDVFTKLHDAFFLAPDTTDAERDIERNRLTLKENLSKHERKLLLRIIDGKDAVAEAVSLASFKAGFSLALNIMNEINRAGHSENHSPSARQSLPEGGAQ